MTRRRLTPEQRRTEILEAAERLIERDGVAVRVEDVVAAAGAAKGTFYTCFATWDDLLEALRAKKAARIEHAVAPALLLAVEGRWHAVLPALARVLVREIIALEGLHDVLFHSAFTLARPLPAAEKPAARIAQILVRGQAAGAWHVAHPDATATLLFAVIHETADAIVAGAHEVRAFAALDELLARLLVPPVGGAGDRP